MRTLLFTQISDSRFTDDTLSEIIRIKHGVIEEMEKLPDVEFRYLNERILTWTDRTNQRRITFHVQKHSSRTTWNDIYTAVNKIKAVPYKFIQAPSIRELKQSPFFQQI
jgi:hypothetical protein